MNFRILVLSFRPLADKARLNGRGLKLIKGPDGGRPSRLLIPLWRGTENIIIINIALQFLFNFIFCLALIKKT